MAYVYIWLSSRNRSHVVRGAAPTYSFMLGATLGTDQIGIARVLLSPAMIACGCGFSCNRMRGPAFDILYVVFPLTRGL